MKTELCDQLTSQQWNSPSRVCPVVSGVRFHFCMPCYSISTNRDVVFNTVIYNKPLCHTRASIIISLLQDSLVKPVTECQNSRDFAVGTANTGDGGENWNTCKSFTPSSSQIITNKTLFLQDGCPSHRRQQHQGT